MADQRGYCLKPQHSVGLFERTAIWLASPSGRRSSAVGDVEENYRLKMEQEGEIAANKYAYEQAMDVLQYGHFRHYYWALRGLSRLAGLGIMARIFGH